MMIDLSEQLNEICLRYSPRCWQSKAALEELRRLWGGVACNGCGVMENIETIHIGLDGERNWYGAVKLAQAPNGWYAVAIDYSYALGGGGSAPSVWNRLAFTAREEATETGIQSLIRRFESVREMACAPSAQALLACRMIDALRTHAASMRQLELF